MQKYSARSITKEEISERGYIVFLECQGFSVQDEDAMEIRISESQATNFVTSDFKKRTIRIINLDIFSTIVCLEHSCKAFLIKILVCRSQRGCGIYDIHFLKYFLFQF